MSQACQTRQKITAGDHIDSTDTYLHAGEMAPQKAIAYCFQELDDDVGCIVKHNDTQNEWVTPYRSVDNARPCSD